MKRQIAPTLLVALAAAISGCAHTGGVAVNPATPVARPAVETDPVFSTDDAADDPAIYVSPATGKVFIIGTDKGRGLEVYDLSGKRLHEYPDGRFNNVDVRTGFPLGGREVDLVVSENRTNNTLGVYSIDPQTGALTNVAAGPIEPGQDVYGSALYRSRITGKLFSFTGCKDGRIVQMELFDNGSGRIDGRIVRTLRATSQTEGIVADDEAGVVFIGEEEVALWRAPAEPDALPEMTMVSIVGPGHPVPMADLEGVSIYKTGERTGYLLLSSQGVYEYVVLDRVPPHEHLGTFRIADGNGIDGVQETDGLDVTSQALPGFPEGLLVVQDGENPGAAQNFKYVDWREVRKAIGLK